MLIPSVVLVSLVAVPSLSRRVNANSQPIIAAYNLMFKLIKKGEC